MPASLARRSSPARRVLMLTWSALAFYAVVAPARPHAEAPQAPIVTVPPGLAPGTPYRLIIVTTTTRDATSANINDYNAFVTAYASSVPQLNALGTTWRAFASTQAVHASTNIGTFPEGVYRLDGILVATGSDQLLHGRAGLTFPRILDQPPLPPYTYTGGALEQDLSVSAWTGTHQSGNPFGQFFLGAPVAYLGGPTAVCICWLEHGARSSTELQPFYAVSGPLTVQAQTSTTATTTSTGTETAPACSTPGSTRVVETFGTPTVTTGPACIGIGNRDVATPSPACGTTPAASAPVDPFHGTTYIVPAGTTNSNVTRNVQTITCVASVPTMPRAMLLALVIGTAGLAAWVLRRS